MTAITRSQGFGRLRNAWAAAHEPAPGVPHWARVAALAIPLTVLPSSIWRIAVCTFHAPIARSAHDLSSAGSGVPGVPLGLYVVLLSIVSELLAFAAIGLISTWGEVFPRWIPVLGGQRVPTLAAVIPAALGAAALTLQWTWTAITQSFGLTIPGQPPTRQPSAELPRLEGPGRGRRLRPAAAVGTATGGRYRRLLEAKKPPRDRPQTGELRPSTRPASPSRSRVVTGRNDTLDRIPPVVPKHLSPTAANTKAATPESNIAPGPNHRTTTQPATGASNKDLTEKDQT